MPVWLQILFPTATIALTVLMLLILPRVQSRNYGKINERIARVENDCWTREERMQLENRLTALETRLEGVISLLATRVLHSPHNPELDRLLDKNLSPSDNLSSEEIRKLLTTLIDIEQRDESLERQMAARLLRTQLIMTNHAAVQT